MANRLNEEQIFLLFGAKSPSHDLMELTDVDLKKVNGGSYPYGSVIEHCPSIAPAVDLNGGTVGCSGPYC